MDEKIFFFLQWENIPLGSLKVTTAVFDSEINSKKYSLSERPQILSTKIIRTSLVKFSGIFSRTTALDLSWVSSGDKNQDATSSLSFTTQEMLCYLVFLGRIEKIYMLALVADTVRSKYCDQSCPTILSFFPILVLAFSYLPTGVLEFKFKARGN